MRINWKVRLKNPTFWVQVIVAIVVPILAYFGMSWDDMTTWAKLGSIFLEAVKNPVIIVSVLLSVWNAINDPTTKGFSDSREALTYEKPKSEGQ
jgi:phi LC3 family holin